MAPERTCLACRVKGGKGELVRLVDGPSGVVIDYAEKLPGRGAYLCPSRACIEKGLDERALSRAFKARVKPPEPAMFMAELVRLAGRRIGSLIGIARKSGSLSYGFDEAARAAAEAPGGVFVISADVSGRTLGRLSGMFPELAARAVRYSDKEALGGLIGAAPVAVLYIRDRGLASSISLEYGRIERITGGEG